MRPNIINIKAFTTDPARGNPATVVRGKIDDPEAIDAVRSATYPTVALVDAGSENEIPIRFFYNFGEIETFACGHATLAAAHVLFLERDVGELVLQNIHGNNIRVSKDARGRIVQQQPHPVIGRTDIDSKTIAAPLAISETEIRGELPQALVGMPRKMKLFVPVDHKTLVSLSRDFDQIKALCDSTGATGIIPYSFDTKTQAIHARHFPNRDEEDLVCGVGAVALAHLLNSNGYEQTEYEICFGPAERGVGTTYVKIKKETTLLIGEAVVEEA